MGEGLSGVAGRIELDDTRRMKAVWVTSSFFDYRIPVYEEVSKRFDGHLVLIFNADYLPDWLSRMLNEALGNKPHGDAYCCGGSLPDRIVDVELHHECHVCILCYRFAAFRLPSCELM